MKKQMARVVIAIIVSILSCGSLAAAEETKSPWEKFQFSVGGLYTAHNSTLRLGANDKEIEIDVENVLDMDDSSMTVRLESHWRFSKNRRHRLDVDWLAIRRDGKRKLFDDIVIDDTVYIEGSTVKSSFDIDIFNASYSYSLFMTDRVDVAASLGLYVAPIKFEIEGGGIVIEKESESFIAPLPTLGLAADFAITPDIFLRTDISALYVEIKRFEGFLIDAGVALEWRPFKYIGFGLKYSYFILRIDAEGKDRWPGIDFTGRIEFETNGAMLYTSVFF